MEDLVNTQGSSAPKYKLRMRDQRAPSVHEPLSAQHPASPLQTQRFNGRAAEEEWAHRVVSQEPVGKSGSKTLFNTASLRPQRKRQQRPGQTGSKPPIGLDFLISEHPHGTSWQELHPAMRKDITDSARWQSK